MDPRRPTARVTDAKAAGVGELPRSVVVGLLRVPRRGLAVRADLAESGWPALADGGVDDGQRWIAEREVGAGLEGVDRASCEGVLDKDRLAGYPAQD